MSHPPKSTMRAPWLTCRSYKGVRLPKRVSRCARAGTNKKGGGKWGQIYLSNRPVLVSRRPSVLEPERSGSRCEKPRAAPLRWMTVSLRKAITLQNSPQDPAVLLPERFRAETCAFGAPLRGSLGQSLVNWRAGGMIAAPSRTAQPKDSCICAASSPQLPYLQSQQ